MSHSDWDSFRPSDFEAELVITALEGAVITRVLAPPEGRAFEFEVTFELGHGRLKALQDQKPPLHFHPYQQEYIEVLEGFICLEIEGQEELLDEASGELCIQPWTNHRLYPPTREMISGNNPFTAQKTVFLLSGSETDHPLKLDLSFFQNWYAYQDQIVIHRAQPSYLQLLSMFDAGGSYLSPPHWIPLGQHASIALGIVLGRWFGGLVGYQPFYREWTTDWEAACCKMETCIFQARFSDRQCRD